jgi:small-conductance mechanosensitive channel
MLSHAPQKFAAVAERETAMPRQTISRVRNVVSSTMKIVAFALLGVASVLAVRALELSDTFILCSMILLVCAYVANSMEELKFEVSCLKEELRETKNEHEEWLKRLGSLIHLVAKDAGQDLFPVSATSTDARSEPSSSS